MLAVALLSTAIAEEQSGSPWSDLTKVFGKVGRPASDGSFRINALRSDLQIQNAAGMLLAPEMGLGSSVKFTSDGVDGELCLIQMEINPVIDDLRAGNLNVTGLGNRFAGEQPSVYFLRFEGKGRASQLARTVKTALAELGRDRFVSEGLNRTGRMPVVDWPAVSLALGFPVSRVGTSQIMAARSGLLTVTFGGCPCGRTIVTGRIEIARDALQNTIDGLRRAKFAIGSITRLGDRTEVAFEGEGDAVRLAGGVRDVLARSNRDHVKR